MVSSNLLSVTFDRGGKRSGRGLVWLSGVIGPVSGGEGGGLPTYPAEATAMHPKAFCFVRNKLGPSGTAEF